MANNARIKAEITIKSYVTLFNSTKQSLAFSWHSTKSNINIRTDKQRNMSLAAQVAAITDSL